MRTRLPRCRLFSGRLFALLLFVVAFAAYCYYYNSSSLNSYKKDAGKLSNIDDIVPQRENLLQTILRRAKEKETLEQCQLLNESVADIDTVTTYPTFEFQPSWMRTKEFWDKSFEDRYELIRNDTKRPRLKVIVVPHSHNDPGWLKTFEQYFEWKTKNIIDNIVKKLTQYPNMTFIWTEISFLSAWWERAHPVKQKALKKLVHEGRLEITTGGWVMPDEACTHIYSLVDQYIEGHHWVKHNLNITPKIGWSIDPFGHGPTVPYLLDQSGLVGTIIQRIHYAWKQWLAHKQIEEFHWLPGWATKKPSLVVHNQPFDIYSIKSTCGPHPSVCLGYDFRKIPGEYSEYTSKYEEITEQNLHVKSKTLIEEYERIGSLTEHNVALVPLGDDFRYEFEMEFDAQYNNYMKMFNYINSHKGFNAEVSFGTPRQYFEAVLRRQSQIPTLKGDFFVYSDIFSEGKPAYWSGYFTSRPFLKILARQFEHVLRTSEILYTLVLKILRESNDEKLISSQKRLERSYEQLISARRNLGLFQHHDAITGTSKASVMFDYGTKLITSIYHCMRIQELALAAAMLPDSTLHAQSVLQSELEWESYGKLPKKLLITLVEHKKIVVFNSLMEPTTEVVTIRSNSTNVRIYDTANKKEVEYQITPNLEIREDGIHIISDKTFDVMFVAKVPALTAITYDIEQHTNTSKHAVIFCNNCKEMEGKPSNFTIKKMMPGDIQLENSVLKLLINRNTGFLRQINRKDINKKNVVEMQFGAYQSAQRHSGAYLFMPDPEAPERLVLPAGPASDEQLLIVAGPVATELSALYLPLLLHTVRIFNVDEPALARAVYIENVLDFESPPKNRETELFMRIQTDIQNGEPPEFHTDQNGFQYQKRVKNPKIGIEGNYYPITTMAWLQDASTRLTLLTAHAQGAAAAEPGRLEVMLDRRMLYDDFRGVGEGLVDNRRTVFQNWLLLEDAPPTRDGEYLVPSAAAGALSRALNYPASVFAVERGAEVRPVLQLAHGMPRGLHLLALRTLTDEILEQLPGEECLLVLQRPPASCASTDASSPPAHFTAASSFVGLPPRNLTAVSLTGLADLSPLRSLQDISLDPMDIKTYRIRF